MTTASILHVGEDLRLRIPVMKLAGFSVLRCDYSVPSIRDTLAQKNPIDVIVFDGEDGAPIHSVVTAVRVFSKAPLVIFDDPLIRYEEDAFDLIIRPVTPPEAWLKRLHEVIRKSRELRERSVKFRSEAAALRSASRQIKQVSDRLRVSPIDPDALWRPDSAKDPDTIQPDRSAEQQDKKR